MSWYYTYYIGYKDSSGKVFPLGPYDIKGRFYPVLSSSRSFASDLHESFHRFEREEISDELLDALYRNDVYQKADYDVKGEIINCGGGWLPIKDLPTESPVKEGYFLIEDVKGYLETQNSYDLFYDHMTPTEYAMRIESELKFGPPKDEGVHLVRDYTYFSYLDVFSKEYEAFLLRNAADMFEFAELPNDGEMVAILNQG